MKTRVWVLAAALGVAAPALADVKAGVDAWSRGDYAAAVGEWRGPATAGDADAQFNLGQAYKLGRGVPVDPALATEWFRKAAAQGHAQAGDNYALALFQDGKKADAVPWLEKSVARDEKRTELVLGTMLFNGDGVTRDWTRAYALVTRSSQQGLPQGSTTLAQMDKYIPEAQRQQGIAMARQIEANARSAGAALPPPEIRPSAPPRAGDGPGTSYAQPGPRAPAPPRARPPVERPPAERPPAERPPVERPLVARQTPPRAAPAASGGNWRIQLGAFRDAGNARRLWAEIGARTGGTAAYVPAGGGITKLQATGFASRADAQRACARAGNGCVVVGR